MTPEDEIIREAMQRFRKQNLTTAWNDLRAEAEFRWIVNQERSRLRSLVEKKIEFLRSNQVSIKKNELMNKGVSDKEKIELLQELLGGRVDEF